MQEAQTFHSFVRGRVDTVNETHEGCSLNYLRKLACVHTGRLSAAAPTASWLLTHSLPCMINETNGKLLSGSKFKLISVENDFFEGL